jgi:DNA-binding winged helix-turn-helix (wHTH) protein
MTQPLFKQSAETVGVLSVLSQAKVGETITYNQLRTQFPGGITDERLRGAITSARRILLRDREMVFSAVPKVGYQLLSSEDVVDASDQDVRSMRR